MEKPKSLTITCIAGNPTVSIFSTRGLCLWFSTSEDSLMSHLPPGRNVKIFMMVMLGSNWAVNNQAIQDFILLMADILHHLGSIKTCK